MLKLIRLSYYLLLLLTPLVMSSITSELFEFNKMMLIYLITGVIAFLWLIEMIRTKKILLRRTPLDFPLLLFLFSQILSTVFSIDRQTSLFGYYDRFNGRLISIIAYLILFYGFVTFMKRDDLKKLLFLTIGTSFLVILWGIPGKLGYDLSCWFFTGNLNNNCWTTQFRPAERMFSTLGQPNWLGAYLAVNFFVGLYFYIDSLRQRNNLKNALFLVYLLFAMSSILFTRSRSALAAVAIGLVLFVIYLVVTSSVKKELKKVLIFTTIIIILPIVFFKTGIGKVDDILSFHVNKKITTQKATVTPSATLNDLNVTDSLDIRKIVWKGAIDLGFKYPLFGTGVETFAYSYYFVRPASHNLTSEWDYLYNKAHNEYLNYLATTGFLGAGSYILVSIVFIAWTLSKLKNKNDILLTGSLLAAYSTILVTNFVGFSTSTSNLYFYLIPAIVFMIVLAQPPIPIRYQNHESWVIKTVLFFLSVSIFFTVVIFLFKYYLADIAYAKSDLYLQSGDYQQAAKVLTQALDLHYEHVYQDKLSTTLADLALVASDSKETDTASKLMTLADYYNNHSIKASPDNVLYWKTSAKNEYLFYQIDLNVRHINLALQALSQAIRLSPTDPKIPYSQALFYSLLYDTEKNTDSKAQYGLSSLKAIDMSISLKSNYEDAYLLRAQLLKKYGQNEEAKKAYRYILDHFDPNNQEAKKEVESL